MSFECNICLDPACEPVVTQCGHLFCWSCLFRWIQDHEANADCPVCKAAVSESNVIPVYGRGSDQSDPMKKPRNVGTASQGSDPSSNIPRRPAAQRPAATSPSEVRGGAVADDVTNVSFSAGFAVFPSLFGLQFQAFGTPQGSLGEVTQCAILWSVIWIASMFLAVWLAFL